MAEFENCATCPIEAGESETVCRRLIINGLCSMWEYKDIPGSGPQFVRVTPMQKQYSPLNPISSKPIEIVLPDEKYL